MATAELKNHLIQLILDTDNPSLLEHLTEYFKAASAKQEWWDTYSTSEQTFIQRSAQQVLDGVVIPNAAVRADINRLLGKANP